MSTICPLHKRQFISFCTSPKCPKPHASICSHEDCLSLHQHPIRQTLSIPTLKTMIIEGCFPLNTLIQKIKLYFQQLRKIMIEQMLNDEQKLLDVIRRYEYCEETWNYKTLLNVVEERYMGNTAGDVWRLFESLNDGGRRERIKAKVNAYQQQLSYKHIQKLFASQPYKQMVLSSLTGRSDTLESKILPSTSPLSKLLLPNSIDLSYYKRIFSASQNNFSASKYHKAIDQISPTLTIIKANNRIFGSYLNTKISSTGTWIADSSKKSFIFSLDKGSLHPLIEEGEGWRKAAYGGNQGPQVGAGLDIYLCDKCDVVKKSGSRLGGSYELGGGMVFKSKQGDEYLAGEKEFLVQDYEVFGLI